MTIDRVRVEQIGGAVGKSYTNFYFQAVTTAALTALGAWFTALKPYIPTASQYVIPATGDTLDEATGHNLSGWTATPPAAIVGTGASIPSVLSGMLIQWRGGAMFSGRRPVGKTIIVPASNAAYVGTGFIAATAATAIDAASVTFIAASTGFIIFHRPVYDRSGPTPVLVRPGGFMSPSQGKLSLKPTVLRSRRD